MKFEGKQGYKSAQSVDNRGKFIRPNNTPRILLREPQNIDRYD
jgi:hypothetical protein